MESRESISLSLARQYLEKKVDVVFDRPLGSKHPKHGFVYEVNYGYLPGVKAPDGGDLDAYYLGIAQSLEKATGVVKAIIHRLNDDDDKLVVMPEHIDMSDDDIERAVQFQEKFFEHEIVRKRL